MAVKSGDMRCCGKNERIDFSLLQKEKPNDNKKPGGFPPSQTLTHPVIRRQGFHEETLAAHEKFSKEAEASQVKS